MNHGQHDHTDVDWDAMGERLESEAELHRPVYRQAFGWLAERAPADGFTRAVDVGSGPGAVSCMLAEAFPAVHVTAVDGSAPLLDRARDRAKRLGLDARVETRHADLPEGLGSLGAADLVWAGRVLHHVGDQQAAIAQLARSLTPGGVFAAVEGGLVSRFLPRDFGIGRPGLFARLDAIAEDWFAEMRATLPGATPTVEHWPGMLEGAGLVEVASRSFLLDLPAPLEPQVRAHLRYGMQRQVDTFSGHLDADDVATLVRLCDPETAEGIMHRPDAFLLNASTVYTGRAPGEA